MFLIQVSLYSMWCHLMNEAYTTDNSLENISFDYQFIYYDAI